MKSMCMNKVHNQSFLYTRASMFGFNRYVKTAHIILLYSIYLIDILNTFFFLLIFFSLRLLH